MKKVDGARPALPTVVEAPTTARAEAPAVPSLAPIDRGTAALVALEHRLAELQLRLVDAQSYTRSAIRTSPLFETDPAVESRVVDALRSALEGAALEDVAATLLAKDAAPSEIAKTWSVLTQRVDALRAERGDAVKEPTDTLVAAVAGRAQSLLGGLEAGGDHRRAMASMVAASEVLGGRHTAGSRYFGPGDFTYSYGFDAYTNEKGLAPLLASQSRRGGAAVGVSGALLDVAAYTNADLIVSTDTNPEIRDWFLTVAATLLHADESARAAGWDDSTRAENVDAWLSGGADEALIAALAQMGLPEDVVARLPTMLDSLQPNRRPETSWLTGEGAPERVAHLTRLALEGKILATTTDLADPELPGRIRAVAEAHGHPVRSFHLSNALDYLADSERVFETLQAIGTPSTMLTTSTDNGPKHEAFKGSFWRPLAQSLETWFEPKGPADKHRAMTWESEQWRTFAWRTAASMISGDFNPDVSSVPADPASFRAAVAELERNTYDDPDAARTVMKRLLQSSADTFDKVFGEGAFDKLELPRPTSFGDAKWKARKFDAELWTEERIDVAIRAKLAATPKATFDPRRSANSKPIRSSRDLGQLLSRIEYSQFQDYAQTS